MSEKTLKIVWLCHFSNEEVRGLYPRNTNRQFYNFVRKLLRLPEKKVTGSDFAGWITGGIEEIRKHPEIELHVISPQTDLRGQRFEAQSQGVYYHFYNPNWTLFLMHLVKNVRVWLKLQNSGWHANKFIKKIKPDLVDLIGVENIYHSCAIFSIDERIPKMLTLQTFYSNPEILKAKPFKSKTMHWQMERMAFAKYKYYGTSGLLYKKLLLEVNPQSIPLAFTFWASKYPQVEEVEKEFDFINFASGLIMAKGPLDTLKALAIVKKQFPQVKLNFSGKIGGFDIEKKDFDDLIVKYGLQDNVSFTSYHATQKDLFQHIKKARFAVLPVYYDVVPGTLMQAMYYELPAVTYATSGTPYLNQDAERVLIAEQRNVEQLAEQMLQLLNNPQKAEELKRNAKRYADEHCDNTRRYNRLLEDYKAIIACEKHGVSIPKHLLLNDDNPLAR